MHTYSFPIFAEFYEYITSGSADIHPIMNLFLQRNAHLDMSNMYSGPTVKQNLNGIKSDYGKISPTPCHISVHYIQKSDHAKLHNFYVLDVSWDDTGQCTVTGIPECIQLCVLGWSHNSGLKNLIC